MKRIVTIGGGTGHRATLMALRELRERGHDIGITALVATTDSGGSSGRLREDDGVLPPGDAMQCFYTLCASEHADGYHEVFRQRVHGNKEDNPYAGHRIGNILFALMERQHGRAEAFDHIRQMFELPKTDYVLPATIETAHLVAQLRGGAEITPEHIIDTRGHDAVKCDVLVPPITHVRLDPMVHAFAPAIRAIEKSDVVVIGPGDLYTSLIAALLPTGFATALRTTHATIIHVVNIMTKHGETDWQLVYHYPECIQPYCGGRRPDHVIYNTGAVSQPVHARYAEEEQFIVQLEGSELRLSEFHGDDLVHVTTCGVVRHDPIKLATAIENTMRW